MPVVASATSALVEQVSLARQAALAGDYVTAATYYRGVAAQITRCVCGHTRQLPELCVCVWTRSLRSVTLCCCWSVTLKHRLLVARRHVHGLGEPQLQKQWLRLRGLVQEEHDVTAALQAASASGRVARPQVCTQRSAPLPAVCVCPPLTHT